MAKKLMDQLEPNVVFLNNETTTLPLFVDERTNICCMGIYSWILAGEEKCFSYFPIIAQPLNFKNLYISMCLIRDIKGINETITIKNFCANNPQLKNSNKMIDYFLSDYLIKQEMNKVIFLPISDFDPYTYECESDDTATFLYLCPTARPKDYNLPIFSETEIEYITKYILNPLGIGIFFSRSTPFLSPVTGKQNLEHYIQAPFSMEIIDTLLYRPTKNDSNEDISLTDAISITYLKYPLRPIFIHKLKYNEMLILHRLIFGMIMLKNHPPIKQWTIENNEKVGLPKYNKNEKIPKFTWVFIYLKSKPNTYSSAVISDKKNQKFLNLFPWDKDAKSIKIVFNDRKAAIMSPYDGYLSVNSDVNWDAFILSLP